jgi:hypothetical protein
MRASGLLRPDATEELVARMRDAADMVERNAILSTVGSPFTLQLQRIQERTAAERKRRLFTDLEPFLAWLDEPLTPDERARARLFMAVSDGDEARQAAFRSRTAR